MLKLSLKSSVSLLTLTIFSLTSDLVATKGRNATLQDNSVLDAGDDVERTGSPASPRRTPKEEGHPVEGADAAPCHVSEAIVEDVRPEVLVTLFERGVRLTVKEIKNLGPQVVRATLAAFEEKDREAGSAEAPLFRVSPHGHEDLYATLLGIRERAADNIEAMTRDIAVILTGRKSTDSDTDSTHQEIPEGVFDTNRTVETIHPPDSAIDTPDPNKRPPNLLEAAQQRNEDRIFGAGRTALEMKVDDILILKHIAARSYDDAIYDHNNDPDVNRGRHPAEAPIPEEMDGILWKKLPFYAQTKNPSQVGSVYYSADSQALVVVFHGSYWLKDWLCDLWGLPKEACTLSAGFVGTVHTGFSFLVKECYQDMMDKIQKALGRRVNENDKVYFTGHSLGGALAILGGSMVVFENRLKRNNIKIVTFSAPRGVIGNQKFVQKIHDKLGLENVLTFSTKGDPVPFVPPFMYSPIGMNIETGPMEKILSYYGRPIKFSINEVLVSIDELLEHPVPSLGLVLFGMIKDYYPAVPTKVAVAMAAAPIYFHTFHGIAADKNIRVAHGYALDNYNNSSRPVEESGEFSLWSVKRNSVLSFFYSFWC